REDDAGKSDDVDGIADARLSIAQANRGIVTVWHAQQREVAARVWRGLAVDVEAERRAELQNLDLEAPAAREQNRQLWDRRHLGRGDRAGRRVAPDGLFALRVLATHESLRPQRRVHARLIDRVLFQLVRDPRGHPVHRIDDVGVGDEIAPAID